MAREADHPLGQVLALAYLAAQESGFMQLAAASFVEHRATIWRLQRNFS